MKALRYVSFLCALVATVDYLLLVFCPWTHRYGWLLFGLQLILAVLGVVASATAVVLRGGWPFLVSFAVCAAILFIQLA